MRIPLGLNLSSKLNMEFQLGNLGDWYAVPGSMRYHPTGGYRYHHVEVGIDWLLDRYPELMACILRGDDLLELRSQFVSGDKPCKPD